MADVMASFSRLKPGLYSNPKVSSVGLMVGSIDWK